jgi:hypothetical protein
MTACYRANYLLMFAPGLETFCPRCGFAGAFAVGVAGLAAGFGLVTLRVSLPVFTVGALFDVSGFCSTGLGDPRCGWAIFAGC